MRVLCTCLLLLLCISDFAGCGPNRHPAPQVSDIAPRPAVSERRKTSDTEARVSVETPPPATPGSDSTAEVPDDLDFLGELAASVAERVTGEGKEIVVLPAVSINPLFKRLEVTELGAELGDKVFRLVRGRLGDRFTVISPLEFEGRLRKSNRTLADLDSVEQAMYQLGERIGVDYMVVGMVYDGEEKFEIAYDCIELKTPAKLVVKNWPFKASDPRGRRLYRKHRDESGQPVLSDFRIGEHAPDVEPSLAAELEWLFGRAMREIIEAANPDLKDLPIAVLPTKLSKDFSFFKYQRKIRETISSYKSRLMAEGYSEDKAMREGPFRILGKTYSSLLEAEDYASELVLEKKTSKAGKLQSTLSRILFETLESYEKPLGVQVVKHEEIVDEALSYSQEELDMVDRRILSDERRKTFQAKGAGALLFSELVEGQFWYEFYFQLRRVDDLGALHPKLRTIVELKYAYKLKDYLE